MGNPFDTIIQNTQEQIGQSANTVLNSVVGANDRLNQQLPLSADAIANRLRGVVAGGANTVQNQINNLLVANKQDPLPNRVPVGFELIDNNGRPVPSLPGFDMMVNPASWQVDLPQKTVQQVKTLGGIQLQYWYPDLGTISANGIIGNMLTASNNTSMLKSDAWIYFKRLVDTFLGNGIASFRGASPATIGQVPFRPTVKIRYYGYTYLGYFETFQFTESEDNPFTRDYSLTYKFYDFDYLDDISVASADPGFLDSISNTIGNISRVLPGGLPSNPTQIPNIGRGL